MQERWLKLYLYEKKAIGQSKRRVLEAHGRKSEILNPCPVESRLRRVRIAEFNRASTKQKQNPNSPMFKREFCRVIHPGFWSFGFGGFEFV